MIRHLAGFEPEKLQPEILRLHPGSAAVAGGCEVLDSAAAIDIDLNRVGAGGIDAGQPQSGSDYFPYLIARDAELSAVLSTSISYMGVAVPLGWGIFRKLPWGMVYRADLGGIPDFHLCHWPKPLTLYTGFQLNGAYAPLVQGVSPQWASVSLQSLVPDNARVARLLCKVDSITTSGTAYVRSQGAQASGIPVGAVNPVSGAPSHLTMDLRVTSTRSFEYRVMGGARLTVGVLGYAQTEPS